MQDRRIVREHLRIEYIQIHAFGLNPIDSSLHPRIQKDTVDIWVLFHHAGSELWDGSEIGNIEDCIIDRHSRFSMVFEESVKSLFPATDEYDGGACLDKPRK